MEAKVDTEARTFTLSSTVGAGGSGGWSGTYPVSEYENWVKFYRGQQDRYVPYTASYQPAVDALARISADVLALRST